MTEVAFNASATDHDTGMAHTCKDDVAKLCPFGPIDRGSQDTDAGPEPADAAAHRTGRPP
jgi:hypothetical protein